MARKISKYTINRVLQWKSHLIAISQTIGWWLDLRGDFQGRFIMDARWSPRMKLQMLNYDYNNRDLWSSSSVRSKTQSREFIAYRELRVLHLQCKSYVKLRQINRAGSRLNKSSIVVCSTRNSLLFYFVLRVIIRDKIDEQISKNNK